MSKKEKLYAVRTGAGDDAYWVEASSAKQAVLVAIADGLKGPLFEVFEVRKQKDFYFGPDTGLKRVGECKCPT